jgi:hypothetical protein
MNPNQVTLDTIQRAIYQARWIDAFGKEHSMASDNEIALRVYEALFEGKE